MGMFPAKRADAGQTITSEIQTITPDIAAKYLERMPHNRNLIKRTWVTYSAAMQTGQWQVGQPLIFDDSGNLIDGQHRLRAVIHSGMAIDFLVVRGISGRVMDHLDTGRARLLRDVLSMRGYKNATVLAGLARTVYLMKQGGKRPDRPADFRLAAPTIAEIVRHVGSDKLLLTVCHEVAGKYKPFGALMKSTRLAGWFIYCGRGWVDDQERLEDFLSIVMGARPAGSASDPAHVLRNRLTRPETAQNKTASNLRLALTIKAWNAFYIDAEIRHLHWRATGSNAEQFPVMLTDRPVFDRQQDAEEQTND